MAISLLVLLVPVFLVVGLYQWLYGTNTPAPVDQTPAVTSARSAGFEVAEPAGLSDQWVPVSAVFRDIDGGITVRLGYVTPEGQGVQLVQSTVPAGRLLPAELTEQARPEGVVEVDRRVWQRYASRPGERVLVLLEPDRTTLVVGPTSVAELRELAASLR